MASKSPKLGRPLKSVNITDSERTDLERWARGLSVSHRLVIRSKVVLACAEGRGPGDIAAELGVAVGTVSKWKRRFKEGGTEALNDLPRPKVDRQLGDAKVEEIIRTTLETTPKAQTHWSTRGLAKKLGVSQSSVGRVWRAFRLKPHLQSTFTLSTDDFFVEKVRDVVGLYMNPPDSAVVLCVDEKSQIQALERGQPVLPMTMGKVQRHTPSYLRHGTTTLFAALDIATGKVVGKTYPRHRAVEFRDFLNKLNREVPKDQKVHVVMDNYATHSAPEIKRWLKRHKRFEFHFVPTYSSWLNQVERWFAELTARALKRGVHRSTRELETSIRNFIEAHNEDPTPFVWTKTADAIIAALERHCQRVLKLENGDQ